MSSSEDLKKIGQNMKAHENKEETIAEPFQQTPGILSPELVSKPSAFLKNLSEVVQKLEQQNPSDFPEISQYLHEIVMLLQELEPHYRKIAASWEDLVYMTKIEYEQREDHRKRVVATLVLLDKALKEDGY